MIGKSLGHYEITAALGAGGMGEVYRARDTRLERDVAIKVLPVDFAADPERLARFEREARLLAQLNHPNIAAVFGLGNEGATRFIAMELVEGETLEERMRRGVDMDDAIEWGRQIATGLEAAHESGVVHRDLKPANIKITPDGEVKILDFGLARGSVGDVDEVSGDTDESPTMLAATGAGIIMGTAAYMSPEQAKGLPLDKRSDIWAFGVIMWEVLAGKRMFDAETVSEVLAAVLRDDIDFEALPARTPPRVGELTRRCLERHAKSRLRDIGEARLVLAAPGGASAAAAVERGVPPWSAIGVAATLGAIALIAGTALVTRSFTAATPPPERPARVLDISIDTAPSPGTALSPDGTKLAYWRYDMEMMVADLRSGARVSVFSREDPSRGYSRPYWSPNGDAIVFSIGSEALAVSANGAGLRSVVELPRGPDGGTFLAGWSSQGIVLQTPEGFSVVSESTGEATLVVPRSGVRGRFGSPAFLPSGAIIFVDRVNGNGAAGLFARVAGESRLLRELPSEFASSSVRFGGGEWLLLDVPVAILGLIDVDARVANGGLWALRFDPGALRAEGEMIRVVPGAASPTMSAEGALIFADVGEFESQVELVLVDRSGQIVDTVRVHEAARPDGRPIPSPDGERFAVIVATQASRELFVYELDALGAPIQVSADPGLLSLAGWLADSQHVVATIDGGEQGQTVLAFPLRGGGGAPIELASARSGRTGFGPRSRRRSRAAMAASGERLTYVDPSGQPTAVEFDAGGVPGVPIALDFAREMVGESFSLSPSGNLAVLTPSPGAGDNPVALVGMPGGAPVFPLSPNVSGARWSHDGSELFLYQRTASGAYVLSVPIDGDEGRPIGAAERLFSANLSEQEVLLGSFSPSADGQHFLMMLVRQPAARHVLVEDFDAFVAARLR